jgi:hypothetical protein
MILTKLFLLAKCFVLTVSLEWQRFIIWFNVSGLEEQHMWMPPMSMMWMLARMR